MYTPPSAAILAALLATSLAAGPQEVWRCGDSYQQGPCPGGRPVDIQDPRSAAERSAHDAEVARQAKAATAMEKSRLQAEKQAARAPATAAAPEPEPQATGGKVFTARVQKPPKKAKAAKARKAAVPAAGGATAPQAARSSG